MKIFLLFILFSMTSFAEEIIPKTPAGWVEMNSLHPVVVTWAYGDPTKDLLDVPSLMVQKFPPQDKLISFVKESPDQNGCRNVAAKDSQSWASYWCSRKDTVLVLLWKGDEALVKTPKEALMKWVLSHE